MLEFLELSEPQEVIEYQELIFELLGNIDEKDLIDSVVKLLSLGHTFIGICENGIKVGFVEYHISYNLQKNSYFILDELVVLENKRSHGIGTKILEHIITLANSQGLNQIGLLVLNNNTKAQNFYKKLGFKPRSKWYLKLI